MKFLIVGSKSVKLLHNLHGPNVLILRGLSTSRQPKDRLAEICASGKVPDTFNFATDVFDEHVAQTPSKIALWMENEGKERKWTFTQLRTESIRAAISLQIAVTSQFPKSKIQNSSVFVLLTRIPEWWFVYLASIRLGAVFCPGTTMLSPEDVAYRLKAASAKIVVTDEANMWKIEKAQRLENFRAPVKIVVPARKNSDVSAIGWDRYDDLTEHISDSDILAFRNRITKSNDIAQIFFTSGTTGKPKMVGHTHTSYGIGHYHTSNVMGIKGSDTYWCLSDPGWAKSSYGNVFSPWIPGATVYINQMERFETRKVMDVLCKRPITAFCAAPTLFRSMIQETDESLFKFNNLRLSIAGGEALNHEVLESWKAKTGLHVANIYGQTETTALTEYHEAEEFKQNSVGRNNAGFDIRIVDDAGNEVPIGEEGNIALKIKPNRPIGLFKGYVKAESDTFEVDENHKSVVGDYYLTGDLAYMDKDRHIFFVGRTDDVIISAGYRIGPFEVESVLQCHPAVAENAVVASPDSHRGAVVKAFIVLSEQYKNIEDKDALAKTLQDYFKHHAAPYKYPRKIEFVDALPKTISGKIIRRDLRQQEYENQPELSKKVSSN
jgi:acyl-coenzyme A synthetase/AMP-(fatty) acid ligase